MSVAIFGDQITKLLVERQAQNILTTLRDTLGGAVSFAAWLGAVEDADLEGLGFANTDVATLRGAFTDLAALNAIIYGGLPPSPYPQPASGYDYSANGKLIIGPQ